jgi:beta-glucosidase
VEWEFGTGLSYSTFTVTDMRLSATTISDDDDLTVTALVTNTGEVKSKYTALLFVTDVYRRVTPEYKLLKRSPPLPPPFSHLSSASLKSSSVLASRPP